MEISVTRRIIGAIVLGLLAIVILPQIFDGEGRIPNRPEMQIPPVIKKPDVSELSVDLPVTARASTNIKPVQEQDVVAKIDVVPDETASTTSSKSPVGTWSLQIASFKSSKNAARLRDNLRSGGFRSYNKETRLSDGSLLTQVMVGPVQDYNEITRLKVAVSEKSVEMGVSGPPLIVKYSP